ncbi:hypothetical protein [Paenibacillus protaetiae]|uniref:Uncharacterized protein n=1 Tax=Paenibacillus protaetiae TaxID=2509456 RepID=A0A4P6EUZ1_9BACL|nr:hypothetical protein [Paenibacillus protaetiae]QAY66812.1 hypothetical protein ET464_10725 [Paenibacillus protaetiae]
MLEQLFPLDEHYIQRFIGLPVHVTMMDGSRYRGILTSCWDGIVGLNGGTAQNSGRDAYLLHVQPKKLKKKKTAVQHKKRGKNKPLVATQAFPFDPADYEPLYSDSGRRERTGANSGRTGSILDRTGANNDRTGAASGRSRFSGGAYNRTSNDYSSHRSFSRGLSRGTSGNFNGSFTRNRGSFTRGADFNRRRPFFPEPVALEMEDIGFLLVII